MGGDDSQKLLPWRGIRIPSRAQQNSGSLQNQHSTSNGIRIHRSALPANCSALQSGAARKESPGQFEQWHARLRS